MVVNNNLGGTATGSPKSKSKHGGTAAATPGRAVVASSYQTDLAGLNFNQAKATLAAGEKKCAEFNIYDEVANISISPSVVDKFANGTGNNGRGSSSGVVAGIGMGTISTKKVGPKNQGASASSAVGNGIIKRTKSDEDIFQNIKKAKALAPNGNNGNGNPPIRSTGREPASTTTTGAGVSGATSRARVQPPLRRSESDSNDCCSFFCWVLLLFLCYSVFVGVKTCSNGKCDIKGQSAQVQTVPQPAHALAPLAAKNTQNQNVSQIFHSLLKDCHGSVLDCIEARHQNLTKQKEQLAENLKRATDENKYYEVTVSQLARNYTVLSDKLNQTAEALERALFSYKKFKNYTDSRILQNQQGQTFLDIRLRKIEDRLQAMSIHFMEDMDHLMSKQLEHDRDLREIRQTATRLTDKVFPKNEASNFHEVSRFGFIFVVIIHGIAWHLA